MFEVYYFFLFKILALVSAILVVNVYNPVHSVLLLVSVFINISAILLILKIEFLAFVYIVVYIGAIAVLFLFVVMMLNIRPNIRSQNSSFVFIWMLGILITIELITFQSNSFFDTALSPFNFQPLIYDSPTNLNVIGTFLFTYGALPFLLSGFILLVAMCGAILLTLSHSEGIRRQVIGEQNQKGSSNAYRSVHFSGHIRI